MERFTADNTEGYSAADLAELNAIFDALVADSGSDLDASDLYDGSALDHLAEEAARRFHDRHAQESAQQA